MNKIPISMHNTYTIYKVKNGIKKEVAHFHNLVVDTMYERLANANGISLHSVWFGTGTAEPQPTDTSLTTPLWRWVTNDNGNSNIITTHRTTGKDNSYNVKCTAKIPATTAYVGEVTEVGLYFYGKGQFMGAKALIKDAEGNPISIVKTDVEELLVDVHVKIQLGASGTFQWNEYWPSYLGYSRYLPCFGYCSTIRMLSTYADIHGAGYFGNKVKCGKTYDANNKAIVFSGCRFAADNVTSQRYVNGIALTVANSSGNNPSWVSGWWKFPNADIFPQRTLTGMSVGTGDGSTTEFKPPLNMWVKDTEKIYVDGVLLTRGVDYTCDHRNNLDELLELRPTAFSKLLNTLTLIGSSIGANYAGRHPLNGGCISYDSSSGSTYAYLLWDKDHPLIWELLEDTQVGLDADYFQMSGIYAVKQDDTSVSPLALKNGVFILSYSHDLDTWVEVGRYTHTGSYAAVYKFVFAETIIAKYWKLDIDITNCSSAANMTRFMSFQNPSNISIISYLGRNGSPIVFTNPPVAGAVITMDADIDRPMKNSNFILDCNPTLQF